AIAVEALLEQRREYRTQRAVCSLFAAGNDLRVRHVLRDHVEVLAVRVQRAARDLVDAGEPHRHSPLIASRRLRIVPLRNCRLVWYRSAFSENAACSISSSTVLP